MRHHVIWVALLKIKYVYGTVSHSWCSRVPFLIETLYLLLSGIKWKCQRWCRLCTCIWRCSLPDYLGFGLSLYLKSVIGFRNWISIMKSLFTCVKFYSLCYMVGFIHFRFNRFWKIKAIIEFLYQKRSNIDYNRLLGDGGLISGYYLYFSFVVGKQRHILIVEFYFK